MNPQFLENFNNGNITKSDIYMILKNNLSLRNACEKAYNSNDLSSQDSQNVIDTYQDNELNINNNESIKPYFNKLNNSQNGTKKSLAFMYYIYSMQTGGKSKKLSKSKKSIISGKIHIGTRGGKYRIVKGIKKYIN